MEKYYETPPFDYSPGLAEFLVKGTFSIDSFMATILRLEDKKVIELESMGDTFKPVFKNTNNENLSLSERVVLNFLTELSETVKTFSFNELATQLGQKHAATWQKYENALITEFHENGFTTIKQISFLDNLGKPTLNKIYITQFLLFWALMFFGMPLIFFFSIISGAIFGFFATFVMFSAFILFGFLCFGYFMVNHILIIFAQNYSIIEWEARLWFKICLRFSPTTKASEHRGKWINFSKFIKDYSEIRNEPIKYHELWGPFYTYALAIGTVKQKS